MPYKLEDFFINNEDDDDNVSDVDNCWRLSITNFDEHLTLALPVKLFSLMQTKVQVKVHHDGKLIAIITERSHFVEGLKPIKVRSGKKKLGDIIYYYPRIEVPFASLGELKNAPEEQMIISEGSGLGTWTREAFGFVIELPNKVFFEKGQA